MALALVLVVASVGGVEARMVASSNAPPRITALSAWIAPVVREGGGRVRGGLRIRFTLCDDGPRNIVGRRYARISVSHRWGDRRREALLVRETSDLITYDVNFRAPECIAGIPWPSTIPADLPYTRFYRCYAVSVRVRDPGGSWSRPVTRVVRGCVPGSG